MDRDHVGVVWRVIGTALQLIGLAVAAYGVSETRQTYAPDRPGIAGTAKRWVWPWFVRVRRWLGHPLPPIELKVDSADMVMIGDDVRVEITHHPLPATMNTDEKVDALDQRSRSHREDLNRLGGALGDEKQAREADVKRLNAALSGESQERQREIDTAMVGGLRLESWGLGTAAVGTLLAAVG